MAPFSSLPPELLGEVARHAQPLSRDSFLKAFKGRIPLFRPVLSNAEVWGLIFKNNKWVNKVLQIRGSPGRDPTVSLVGADLKKICHGGRTERTYLVLAIHDWTGDMRRFQDVLFGSLQDHKYDEARSEVYLTRSGITLYIGDAVTAEEWLYMTDPSRMFHLRKGKLSTNVIYHADNALYDIEPGLIGGIKDYSRKKKKAIRQICSIKLKFRDGTPVYRVFVSFSKSVRVVNITDGSRSEWITHWRLAQPDEREWWP